MYMLRITITRIGAQQHVAAPTLEITVATESSKRITKGRAARLLAKRCPGFRRRRGRSSAGAGAEILPVLEEIASGWRAWRLYTDGNRPSGFEPPLRGRVGKSNSRGNPFADRGAGVWEQANIVVEPDEQSAA